MASSSDGDGFKPPTLIEIISEKFRKPAAARGGGAAEAEPDRILDAKERKVAMRTVDAVERKWAKAALVLSTIMAFIVPIIAIVEHKKATVGSHKTTTVPDAILFGGAVLLFSALGFFALYRRRRSLLAFSLFLIGFGLTIPIGVAGFAFILLGAWLMLRAWRLQKYGTANAKQVARAASTRPSRKVRQEAAKTPVKPTGHTPPKANKRYTPKAPTKKRIAKPVDKVE
jgi:hypothetical protein